MQKNRDLTSGSITGGLWAFAVPLMLGNVLQQFYNLADTWVVGKYIGDNALAAVGSSYTLMTFLTSVRQKRAGLHTQWHIHVSGDNRNTYIADNRRVLHAY